MKEICVLRVNNISLACFMPDHWNWTWNGAPVRGGRMRAHRRERKMAATFAPFRRRRAKKAPTTDSIKHRISHSRDLARLSVGLEGPFVQFQSRVNCGWRLLPMGPHSPSLPRAIVSLCGREERSAPCRRPLAPRPNLFVGSLAMCWEIGGDRIDGSTDGLTEGINRDGA